MSTCYHVPDKKKQFFLSVCILNLVCMLLFVCLCSLSDCHKCWMSFWLATIPLVAGPLVVVVLSHKANFRVYTENGLCNKHDCGLNVESFIFHSWIIFQNICNIKRKPLVHLFATLCTRVTTPAFWPPVSFFTFYFCSSQLVETCEEKSEKFHPSSLYYCWWAIGSSENLWVPDF